MKINKERVSEISPSMFGLFFEDINFAADGGLYAELIENRSFEAKEAFGNPGKLYTVDDFGYAWDKVATKEGDPVMKIVSGAPLSSVNPHYLKIATTAPNQGFTNKSYDGIYLPAGEVVNITFYARAVEYTGNFVVSIKDDKEVLASKTVNCQPIKPFKCFHEEGEKVLDTEVPSSDWVKYELKLTMAKEAKAARLYILLDSVGTVDFDFISAIPDSAVEGVFRKDLFDALKDMNPGFIRFPGGCIVEGISLDNRYQWKNTVGPLVDRKYIPSLWAFFYEGSDDLNIQSKDPHYGQSYGLGFYEYFLLCEKLGAKALPVLGMAVACQFRSTEVVDIDSPEFMEYVQDALDLIEFANGDVTTKWGALRADMGHPESFNLEFVAIGNEQWISPFVDPFSRNDIFEKKIHEKYPDIKILGTAGPGVDMREAKIGWDYYRTNEAKKPGFCYAVDEHYYQTPEWMYSHVNMYDNYPNAPYVFAGEYATHTKTRDNSMESALCEASFLTGLEKNAGVVKLASYAPLFNRIGHSQWKPDMIWFDSSKVYLTPNYHVQSMYMNNTGAYTLKMDDETIALRESGIYISLSEDNDGSVILKVVNTTGKDYTLPLNNEAGDAITTEATIETLTGSGVVPSDMPEESSVENSRIKIDGNITLKKLSFNVIRF